VENKEVGDKTEIVEDGTSFHQYLLYPKVLSKQMPKSSRFTKEMHTKKTKYLEEDMVELTTGCSELVQKNIK